MSVYVGWGFGGLVVAVVVWCFCSWIAGKIIKRQDLDWHEERDREDWVNMWIVLVVFPAVIGLALWRGPIYTAEVVRQDEARYVAYLASLPQMHVTVAETELVVGSYSSGKHSVSSAVYGIHVLTKEFPTQKILIHKRHGMMDVYAGQRLVIWLDGWVAAKVEREEAFLSRKGM